EEVFLPGALSLARDMLPDDRRRLGIAAALTERRRAEVVPEEQLVRLLEGEGGLGLGSAAIVPEPEQLANTVEELLGDRRGCRRCWSRRAHRAAAPPVGAAAGAACGRARRQVRDALSWWV